LVRLPTKSTIIWIYKVNILGIYDKNISTVEIGIPLKQFKQYWLSKGAIVKLRPKLGWGAKIQANNLNLREEDRYPCPWLTRTVSIRWDGNFNQCDADWDGKYGPGNIYEQSIKDMWDGELSSRRQKHWNGDYSHELCSKCKDWQVARSRFYYPKEIAIV